MFPTAVAAGADPPEFSPEPFESAEIVTYEFVFVSIRGLFHNQLPKAVLPVVDEIQMKGNCDTELV